MPRWRGRVAVERMSTQQLWRSARHELNALRDMSVQGADRKDLKATVERLHAVLAELELRGVQIALFPA